MLVLAQVSSMNTRREGSSRPWYFFHCARRRATSGRSCSLACTLFFEADAFVLKEVPHRVATHLETALGQFSRQCPQRDVRLIGHSCQQPFALPGNRIGAPPAHLAGCRAAGRAEPLRPLHHAGDADLERRGNLPAARPCRYRSDHSLSKSKGIGSGHRMLAYSPASTLNQTRPLPGIPPDSEINKQALGSVPNKDAYAGGVVIQGLRTREVLLGKQLYWLTEAEWTRIAPLMPRGRRG